MQQTIAEIKICFLLIQGHKSAIMEKAPNNHVRQRLMPIQTRAELVKDTVRCANLPARAKIRDATARYVDELMSIFAQQDVDTGRAIAAIDAIQTAKNIAYDALDLPFVAKHVNQMAADLE